MSIAIISTKITATVSPSYKRRLERLTVIKNLWPALSTSEIGAEIGVSKNTVCGLIWRNGLSLTTKPRRTRRRTRHTPVTLG